MKRLFFIFCTFSLCAKPLHVRVVSPIAILINAETGQVLYEKSADRHVPPASITKVPAAAYALQKVDDLDRMVQVPKECLIAMAKKVKIARQFVDPPHLLQPDSTKMGLRRGEEISLRDLLHGHLLCSASDASNVIAKHVGPSLDAFVAGMNAYIRKMGCTETHFYNAHGTTFPGHITTAREFAKIMAEAIKHPVLLEMMGKPGYQMGKTNRAPARTIRQFCALVNPESKYYYPKAIGGKTGFHDEARWTLAVAARDQGRTLVAIILQSPTSAQRFQDAIALFEAAFSEKKLRRQLFNAEENTFLRKVKGSRRRLRATLHEDVALEYYPAEEREVVATIDWKTPKLPIAEGDFVGDLILEADGNEVERHPLYATAPLQKTRRTWPYWLLLLLIPVGLTQLHKRRH